MYNYLNYLFESGAEESSIKNKSILEDLLKGIKLKTVYITNGENNMGKAYDDLVSNNKKIDDVAFKNVDNKLSDRNKNIFKEAKMLFDLRFEIYKKLVFKKENLEFEKGIGKTVKLKNQKDIFSEKPNRTNLRIF